MLLRTGELECSVGATMMTKTYICLFTENVNKPKENFDQMKKHDIMMDRHVSFVITLL